MPTRKFTHLLRFLAVVLGFSLAASCAQAHRGSDPVFSSPQPPAADAPLVAATASVPGRLAVVHADYFDQGRGEYQVVVRSDDGRVTTLILPNVPDVLEIGMSVIAEGRVATDGVSLEASSITVLALPELPARDLAQSPITNNVLVILIKFTDSPAGDPFTPAAVQQVMVTDTNSVANYYNEVSYGQQL